MPVKGNQFKSNSFKQENQPRQPSSKIEKERPIRQKQVAEPTFDLMDGRLFKIGGLFSLLLSLYFLVAFTSYLFTWQEDQSYVSPTNGGWHNLFKTTQELMDNGVKNPVVENWLGKLGALLSNQFIFEWFGLASFLFVFVLFVIGYRLVFKISLFAINKTLAYSLFGLIFISVALGFVHAFIADTPNYVEGGFGYWSNRLLDAQIGQAGTGLILVFAALSVLVIAYNIDFKIPQRKAKETVAPVAVDEVIPQTAAVELDDEDISLPREWEGRNRETSGNKLKQMPLTEQPVVQNPIFHEPIVLSPTPPEEGHEPEFENEIPLTVDVARPTPVLNIEKDDNAKANSLVDQFGEDSLGVTTARVID